MNVEGEPPLAHIVSELNRVKGRLDALEQYVSQLLELIEHLYSIVNIFATERNEEGQKLKELVARVRAFAKEKIERLTQP
jgi:hypothetical protein